ncbi:membrane-bound lytic murein transglycosylase D [Dyadobacter jejuensis]|uniref:Membrane-bound lytic murein transglycosylase D n=1 Tax=Dyadobacter jejuensis TaxID=1082580 RepID=A0A316ACA6_9BACT|nr:LysM peptidoglycan-binding domain-containing protein [Dyadobacter jejuensis]PWJ54524.1 membrane-bound lytic murein transglycosylase D [Dyadobacter jejuensis]
MRIKLKKYNSTNGFLLALLMLIMTGVRAQDFPKVPDHVNFGGINVKFDKGAQRIIEQDIKSLMGNQKFWEEKMDRAILYFPIVEGILMDEEVPIDFKYLAAQESSFKPDVVSSSKAVGFWQFKAETAIEMNLRVDNEVDERKNISSSTHGAAWYLKKNNQQFNNWVATLYSYYLGAGAVKKIVPSNWAYAREVSLTNKTDRYVLRFFAHKIALEAGIERYRSKNKLVLLESDFGKGRSYADIAQTLGINRQELQEYNRWFVGERVPDDREYLLTIPVSVDHVVAVREKLSMPAIAATVPVARQSGASGYPILKPSNVQPKGSSHEFYEINGLAGILAKPGDTPKSLAKAGKLSISKFMKANDLVRDMPIIPGNVYYLAKKRKQASVPFHVAEPGDTWQAISQQYAIRLVNLLKNNRTISRNYPIQTGQKLYLNRKRPRKEPIEIVPVAPPTPMAPPAPMVTEAAKETEPATNDIPSNSSERKKYAPVLVESKPMEPTPAVEVEKPAVVVAAEIKKPTPSTPTTSQVNDRVVIISQDDNDSENTQVGKNTISTERPKEVASNGFESEQTRVASKPSGVKKAQSHIVSSGETYFSIARMYDLSVTKLLALNNRSIDTSLLSGDELIVEGTGSVAATPSTAEVAVPKKAPVVNSPVEPKKVVPKPSIENKSVAQYHTVESGQTYYSISKLHGLTVNELLGLNALSVNDKLAVGQRLIVRKGQAAVSAAPAASEAPGYHVVRSGETLFSIARRYNMTVDQVKRLNNMSSNTVLVDQKLKIAQ